MDRRTGSVLGELEAAIDERGEDFEERIFCQSLFMMVPCSILMVDMEAPVGVGAVAIVIVVVERE